MLKVRFNRISAISRTSAALFAIGPTQSKNSDKAYTPLVSRLPCVSLRAYRPERVDGVTIDPTVSVPIARGLKPEATATAEPVEDPPGAWNT